MWAYQYGPDKKIIQHFIGITVGSPDITLNSPCQGGQTIVAMFAPGPVQKWIDGVINERVVTK